MCDEYCTVDIFRRLNTESLAGLVNYVGGNYELFLQQASYARIYTQSQAEEILLEHCLRIYNTAMVECLLFKLCEYLTYKRSSTYDVYYKVPSNALTVRC